MKISSSSINALFLLVTLFLVTSEAFQYQQLKRSDFPSDFVFGAASAAYQYEGAVREGGRGPSIWDTFTHQHPEKVVDHTNGDVAVDFYHRYKDDIGILKNIGMNAFRFSISWSRILPDGKASSGVNKEGVQFYNNLIDELLANDIQPFVTLFHWDVPQALEDEYGGFLQNNIVKDYEEYVDICFKEFGDRVKIWMTLNEPYIFTTLGYELGIGAPGRCSSRNTTTFNTSGGAFDLSCTAGNSQTEPYIVGHNLLLAHSAAVYLYKTRYQISQKGKIGIAQAAYWYMHQNISDSQPQASVMAMDSSLGWFVNPIVNGDYPASMKDRAGNALPNFTEMQKKMLKGSFDFIGINYYLAAYPSSTGKASLFDRTIIYPQGIRDVVFYLKENYNNPVIYITENGVSQHYNATFTMKADMKDKSRIQYYKHHLWYLQKAIKEGANVKGHIAWTLLDDFEWGFGYEFEFGLVYVDRENGLKRYPKQSAFWYKKFLLSK